MNPHDTFATPSRALTPPSYNMSAADAPSQPGIVSPQQSNSSFCLPPPLSPSQTAQSWLPLYFSGGTNATPQQQPPQSDRSPASRQQVLRRMSIRSATQSHTSPPRATPSVLSADRDEPVTNHSFSSCAVAPQHQQQQQQQLRLQRAASSVASVRSVPTVLSHLTNRSGTASHTASNANQLPHRIVRRVGSVAFADYTKPSEASAVDLRSAVGNTTPTHASTSARTPRVGACSADDVAPGLSLEAADHEGGTVQDVDEQRTCAEEAAAYTRTNASVLERSCAVVAAVALGIAVILHALAAVANPSAIGPSNGTSSVAADPDDVAAHRASFRMLANLATGTGVIALLAFFVMCRQRIVFARQSRKSIVENAGLLIQRPTKAGAVSGGLSKQALSELESLHRRGLLEPRELTSPIGNTPLGAGSSKPPPPPPQQPQQQQQQPTVTTLLSFPCSSSPQRENSIAGTDWNVTGDASDDVLGLQLSMVAITPGERTSSGGGTGTPSLVMFETPFRTSSASESHRRRKDA
jgi:hypothetical protein